MKNLILFTFFFALSFTSNAQYLEWITDFENINHSKEKKITEAGSNYIFEYTDTQGVLKTVKIDKSTGAVVDGLVGNENTGTKDILLSVEYVMEEIDDVNGYQTVDTTYIKYHGFDTLRLFQIDENGLKSQVMDIVSEGEANGFLSVDGEYVLFSGDFLKETNDTTIQKYYHCLDSESGTIKFQAQSVSNKSLVSVEKHDTDAFIVIEEGVWKIFRTIMIIDTSGVKYAKSYIYDTTGSYSFKDYHYLKGNIFKVVHKYYSGKWHLEDHEIYDIEKDVEVTLGHISATSGGVSSVSGLTPISGPFYSFLTDYSYSPAYAKYRNLKYVNIDSDSLNVKGLHYRMQDNYHLDFEDEKIIATLTTPDGHLWGFTKHELYKWNFKDEAPEGIEDLALSGEMPIKTWKHGDTLKVSLKIKNEGTLDLNHVKVKIYPTKYGELLQTEENELRLYNNTWIVDVPAGEEKEVEVSFIVNYFVDLEEMNFIAGVYGNIGRNDIDSGTGSYINLENLEDDEVFFSLEKIPEASDDWIPALELSTSLEENPMDSTKLIGRATIKNIGKKNAKGVKFYTKGKRLKSNIYYSVMDEILVGEEKTLTINYEKSFDYGYYSFCTEISRVENDNGFNDDIESCCDFYIAPPDVQAPQDTTSDLELNFITTSINAFDSDTFDIVLRVEKKGDLPQNNVLIQLYLGNTKIIQAYNENFHADKNIWQVIAINNWNNPEELKLKCYNDQVGNDTIFAQVLYSKEGDIDAFQGNIDAIGNEDDEAVLPIHILKGIQPDSGVDLELSNTNPDPDAIYLGSYFPIELNLENIGDSISTDITLEITSDENIQLFLADNTSIESYLWNISSLGSNENTGHIIYGYALDTGHVFAQVIHSNEGDIDATQGRIGIIGDEDDEVDILITPIDIGNVTPPNILTDIDLELDFDAISNTYHLGEPGIVKLMLHNVGERTSHQIKIEILLDNQYLRLINTPDLIGFDIETNIWSVAELAGMEGVELELKFMNMKEGSSQITAQVLSSVEGDKDAFQGEYGVFGDEDDETTFGVFVNTVGVENLLDMPVFLYPNPAHDKITIDGLMEASKITILGVDGRVYLNQKTNKVREVINISTLPNGVYYTKIVSNKSTISKAFLKY